MSKKYDTNWNVSQMKDYVESMIGGVSFNEAMEFLVLVIDKDDDTQMKFLLAAALSSLTTSDHAEIAVSNTLPSEFNHAFKMPEINKTKSGKTIGYNSKAVKLIGTIVLEALKRILQKNAKITLVPKLLDVYEKRGSIFNLKPGTASGDIDVLSVAEHGKTHIESIMAKHQENMLFYELAVSAFPLWDSYLNYPGETEDLKIENNRISMKRKTRKGKAK